MFVAPFNDQDVVASFADQVVDGVVVAAGVLDEAFLAWSLGSVHADVEDVVAWGKQMVVKIQFT
jgi:hypothetical protein